MKEYSPFTDGKTKAVHALIGAYRTLSKWVNIPIILGAFVLVKFKLLPEPTEPPLPGKKETTLPAAKLSIAPADAQST